MVSEEGYTFKAAATAVNVSEQGLRVWYAKLVPAAPPCGDDATLGTTRGRERTAPQAAQVG